MAPSRGVTHDVECITGAGGEGRTVLACDRLMTSVWRCVAMRGDAGGVVRTIVGTCGVCRVCRPGRPAAIHPYRKKNRNSRYCSISRNTRTRASDRIHNIRREDRTGTVTVRRSKYQEANARTEDARLDEHRVTARRLYRSACGGVRTLVRLLSQCTLSAPVRSAHETHPIL